MKKTLLVLAIILVTFLLTFICSRFNDIPVEERKEKTKFKTDIFVNTEDIISIYNIQKIRENIGGKWNECDCIGLCYCTPKYHILEEQKEEDFYLTFIDKDYLVYPLGEVYQYQDSIKFLTNIKNILPFLKKKGKKMEDIIKVNYKSIYDESATLLQRKIPIIVTDSIKSKAFMCDGDIIFCVPYTSTDKECIIQGERSINNILSNSDFMSIYVVYTDEVIVEYSNLFYNGDKGFIRIYVP